MDVKQQSVVSNKSQILKMTDLFDFSNATKYIVINAYGSSNSGALYANNKAIQFVKFYPNMVSKTIVYEFKNGAYTNDIYGTLDKLQFKTNATSGALNVISASTVNFIDPSFYSDNVLGSITALTNKITPIEYSSAILTGSGVSDATISNLTAIAKSYVGQYWSVQQPWDLIETMAAQIGTSLPISSIGQTYDAISNGKWQLKYNGNKPFGDWKTLLNPGDIIMLSDPDFINDTVAVVTSGKNETAMVIDTAVNSKNLFGSTVKILPEHLLSSENVYDLALPSNVFIYSLNNPTVYTNTNTVIDSTVNTNLTVSPNSPYLVPIKYNQIYVTPKPDLNFGLNETFSVQLSNIFSIPNQNTKVTQTVSGLPSWMKYNSTTQTLTGKTPNMETTAHLSIKGTLGTGVATDFMDVFVNRNQLVNIEDTIWKAAFNNSLSINKGINEPYYFTSNSKLNLTWLHIDQTKGELYGIPPLAQIGQSIDITVYQQANPRALHDHVDSFYINIAQPINLIGSPLLPAYT